MKLLTDWGFGAHSWQGQRGEYWVLAQLALVLGFAALPIYRPSSWWAAASAWHWWSGLAALVGLGGIVIFAKGLLDLGSSLTPLPYPREDGGLVQSGLYGQVRHPVYSGVVFVAIAWALYQVSLSHLFGACVLFVFFNAKANQEERWLTQKYPTYAEYQQQVKKLIPWVF